MPIPNGRGQQLYKSLGIYFSRSSPLLCIASVPVLRCLSGFLLKCGRAAIITGIRILNLTNGLKDFFLFSPFLLILFVCVWQSERMPFISRFRIRRNFFYHTDSNFSIIPSTKLKFHYPQTYLCTYKTPSIILTYFMYVKETVKSVLIRIAECMNIGMTLDGEPRHEFILVNDKSEVKVKKSLAGRRSEKCWNRKYSYQE